MPLTSLILNIAPWYILLMGLWVLYTKVSIPITTFITFLDLYRVKIPMKRALWLNESVFWSLNRSQRRHQLCPNRSVRLSCLFLKYLNRENRWMLKSRTLTAQKWIKYVVQGRLYFDWVFSDAESITTYSHHQSRTIISPLPQYKGNFPKSPLLAQTT